MDAFSRSCARAAFCRALASANLLVAGLRMRQLAVPGFGFLQTMGDGGGGGGGKDDDRGRM